tara:strand:+ start:257 stop:958 length:702 start_codon:yes stop_codon:yes gene_type:complete
MNKVSVIIPTFNRYYSLFNAVDSVKQQTYKHIEIIVVDDNSTDDNYNNLKIEGVKIIKLEEGSKQKLNYGCGALPRNVGMYYATGDWIAFLDDDDIWMPNKLEFQMNEMIKHNSLMSSTDGYIGSGYYNPKKIYKIYNKEYYYESLKKIFNYDTELPDLFNKKFVEIHNPIITSSVCFNKDLYHKIGDMKLIKNGGEIINGVKEWQDWDYWKRMLQHTDCLYIKEPLFYYNNK